MLKLPCVQIFKGSDYEVKEYSSYKKVTGAFIDWVYDMINVTHTYALLLGPQEETKELNDPFRPAVSNIPRAGEELTRAVISMTRRALDQDTEEPTTTAVETTEDSTEESTGRPTESLTSETTEGLTWATPEDTTQVLTTYESMTNLPSIQPTDASETD